MRWNPSPNRERSIYEFMRDAAQVGAAFRGCHMALRVHGLVDRPLIPEYSGTTGATVFVTRALDAEWSTLVFWISLSLPPRESRPEP